MRTALPQGETAGKTGLLSGGNGKGDLLLSWSLRCLGQREQLQGKRGREAGKGRKGGWKRTAFINSS